MAAMSTFDERAAEWDTPERQERARTVARAIRASGVLVPTMRAIDLGAGTGLLGIELAGEVHEVVLADPSDGMLDVARQKIAAEELRNVTAVRFDLLTDPPPGDPFDLAVSLLMLHHLPDTAAALGAIYRLLVPDGRLALADLDTEDGSFHDPDAEGIYYRGFERTALADLARMVGFTEVTVGAATEIDREGHRYQVFLLRARRA
jgi:ubiquinone/menaquinone biosynthesis C-methylase UbiE